MSMLEFPIRRYQFTLVAFLMLVALGWFTFSSIPREEDPSFKLAGFQIAAIMPGADPKDLERLVAKPIEDRLAELDDVHDMETRSSTASRSPSSSSRPAPTPTRSTTRSCARSTRCGRPCPPSCAS